MGYSEMMDMNIKLTNKKKNSFQCYHNNRGYCKFQEECRFQHFKEVCQKRLCKDIECEKRHPCRNGLYCKFNKVNNCYFRHEDSNEEQNIEKEEIRKKLKEYEDDVKKLKSEIDDLRKIVSIKEIELENKIAKESEQSNKIKEFKIQNNLEISDLKFTVKTKEIELKGRYAKEKELSTVIEELKINNEKLKTYQ